ncbi:hypothetical protein SAMN05446037_100293 [Anaerovirgula multivorans]|uniref:Uncharacterized protein n=1 Tax=Anaerovirgula multivorans TaxID=312168 RepID=A0A239ALD1_9FIRM|nr:hypothetical protein [Anaerovirgula multivorans]SNR95874.1 hypothetical protein SAMN05446037_100293 [Anaerovirgula multivorans]
MPDMAKVREFLEVMNRIAIYLDDDEISDIGLILLRATKRMEKETKESEKE